MGLGAFLLGRETDDESEPGATGTTAPAVTTPAGFVTVADDEGGFTIKHPKEWKSIRPPAGDERLLLSAGGQNYLRLRVVAIEPGIDVKSSIEQGLTSEGVKVVKQQEITVNGIPGLYYLYTFSDPSTEKEGVHAHYFLVRGQKMYTMVFQALPTEEFTRLAPVFDKVAESFTSTSDKPAPTPTSTPAPAETPTTASPQPPTTAP